MERRVPAPSGTELTAIFWTLGVWTILSLIFALSITFTNVANAQSSDTNAASLLAINNNEGIIDMRPTGRETGLPIPRFVSFRNDKTNMRVGPGIEFEIKAIYNRKGLPVQVLAESGHWREVIDWEETRGWVHKDLLSSRRMGRVKKNWVNIVRQPGDQAKPLAHLARGVLALIKSCRGNWCVVEVDDITGWISRSEIFGTFSHEDFS